MKLQHSPIKKLQQGVMMLEALIGILIFSLGILAIIGLQGQTIKNSSEAKYRADASFLANQIIGRMWADRANLASYAHRPGGTVCAPTGSASGSVEVTNWLANVTTLLPKATATTQSIQVNTANGQVAVLLCWTSGADQHNLVVNAQIGG